MTLSASDLLLIFLVTQGLKDHEIAQRLGTTTHIVKNHLRAIYDNTGFNNRVELALWHTKALFERETVN